MATFRVLGRVEVRDGERQFVLGGPRQVSLLAFLLLHANRAVSNDEIVDALWGPRRERSVKRLQMAVARLRKALEPLVRDGEPILRTVSGGYVLAVAPGELDADVFSARVEEGRRALDEGLPARASDLLRSALDLWRGPALADVAYEAFALAPIRRLEELRLSAVEARLDADLQLGRHAELIAEIDALVSQYPTREHLAGQLMLALYRSGRQADALDTYQRARARLAEELGLEPGPALRSRQASILRQDPALELQPPRSLPPELDPIDVPTLAGRTAELAWLQDRWWRARGGRGALVAVTGPRGIGKTRLAAELARDAHEHGDTVIYASCDGPTDAIGDALAKARETSRPSLLVVDDLDAATPDVLAQLAELAHWVPHSPVLVYASARKDRSFGSVGATPTLELEPLGVDAIHSIAATYGPDDAVPDEWLMDATGGVPARVHELSRQWARRETGRRVDDAARKTAVDRDELRSMEATLAGHVVELQAARARAAVPRDHDLGVICPFKGLAAFDVADADYFFGRERLIAELVARLVGAPLLGIVGPSGSGKSSVLRAGLLPELANGVIPGSEAWKQVLIRPGEHPPRDLRDRVSDDRHVIAVDQFEETFTTCRDESARAAFIFELVRLADERRGVVVLALRADQYGRCARYPELTRLLAGNQVLVGGMTRDELRETIEGPARRCGLIVEPGLANALTDEVAGEPGALPLLSTALLELWQRREGRRLSLAVYERTGGVRGAVARLAETAYGALDDPQKEAARSVLLRMVREQDGALERRRVPLTEFGDDWAPVVATLIDRRLLTASAGAVEIAHEALLREWPRLSGWLDADVEGRRQHQRLTETAREWSEHGRDAGDLYRGARLASALDWENEHRGELNRVDREFLRASESAARRRTRRLQALAAALSGLVIVAAISAVFALRYGARAHAQQQLALSRSLATVGMAHLARDVDLAALLSVEGYRRGDTIEARSAVLATLPGLDRAAGALIGHQGGVNAVAFSPDRRTLASGAYDMTVRFWDMHARRPTGRPLRESSGVLSIAFSPDGKTLAVAREDGALHLWDFARHRPLGQAFRAHGGEVFGVAFSPDGRTLASAGADGSVRLWDALTHERLAAPLTGHAGAVRCVAFNRAGTAIASAGEDGTVRIWDAHSLRLMAPPLTHDGPVWSVAFAPDGRSLASGDDDGTVRIWEARTGREIGAPLTGHLGPVWSVAFSPNGRWVASAGDDNRVRLWETATHRLNGLALRGHTDTVETVAFSPDGQMLASGSDDKSVRLWTVSARPLAATLAGHAGSVKSLAFDHDGRTLATTGGDGSVRLWDVGAHAPLGSPLRGHRGAVESVAFSRDGGMLASAGSDGTVRLWDSASRRALGPPLRGHRGTVRSVSFSADRRMLASGGDDAAVRLWDVTRHRALGRLTPSAPERVEEVAFAPVGTMVAAAGDDGNIRLWDGARRRAVGSPLAGHTGRVQAIAFSRDGRTLASASEDGTVRLWDTARRRQIGSPLQADTDPHRAAVAFSPDGRTLASGTVHGGIQLWDLATRRSIGEPLKGHTRAVESLAFSPDGTSLATAGADGLVRLWDPILWSDNRRQLRDRVCGAVRRNLHRSEWRSLIPGEPYRETCPQP